MLMPNIAWYYNRNMFLKYEQSANILFFFKNFGALQFYSLFNHGFIPNFGCFEAKHIDRGRSNVRKSEVVSAKLYLVLIGGKVVVDDKGNGI